MCSFREAFSATRSVSAGFDSVEGSEILDAIRWDEKAGLRRDAVRSQVIDALEAQEIKETGKEED
jgi:hypothetical protein